jgi:hypothetical protein
MDAAGAAQEIQMEEIKMELGGAQYSVPADLAAEMVKMLEAKGLKPMMGDAKPDASAEIAAVKADAQRKLDQLQARVDALQSVDASKAMREAITQEIRKELAVDEMAKRFDVDISDAKSFADKQRKLATKLAPSIKLDGKSDDYVASLIDFSVMAREEQTAASPRAGFRADTQDNQDPAEAARKEMMSRFEIAHKGAK